MGFGSRHQRPVAEDEPAALDVGEVSVGRVRGRAERAAPGPARGSRARHRVPGESHQASRCPSGLHIGHVSALTGYTPKLRRGWPRSAIRKNLPSGSSPNAIREPTFGAHKPRQLVTNRVGGRSRPPARPIVRIRQSSAAMNVSTPWSSPCGQFAGASSCGVGPVGRRRRRRGRRLRGRVGLASIVVVAVSQPRTESASASPPTTSTRPTATGVNQPARIHQLGRQASASARAGQTSGGVGAVGRRARNWISPGNATASQYPSGDQAAEVPGTRWYATSPSQPSSTTVKPSSRGNAGGTEVAAEDRRRSVPADDGADVGRVRCRSDRPGRGCRRSQPRLRNRTARRGSDPNIRATIRLPTISRPRCCEGPPAVHAARGPARRWG